MTVSAYIVRLDAAEPSLMLHLHRKLGKYLQFGGHVELDEDPWHALVHELAEESGYDMEQLQILQPQVRLASLSDAKLHPVPMSLMTHQFPGMDHYHTDIAFAFVAHEVPKNAVREGESTTMKVFTIVELQATTDDEVPANVRETGLFVLKNFQSWKPISTDAVNDGEP